jgi:hypothetical protein
MRPDDAGRESVLPYQPVRIYPDPSGAAVSLTAPWQGRDRLDAGEGERSMLLKAHPNTPVPDRSPVSSWAPGEQMLALTLITTWALATGRNLRSDVPPDQLTREELIEFWADPLSEEAGK